jgi:putative nucleotidyltransferase with HDIG domain
MTAQEHAALFLGLCRTICVVPLRADNRSLGLVVLGEERSEEREPFTSEKIRFARSIGDQAASALHRAELFDELERAYVQTVLGLANAVEAKDSYTSDHVQNVAQMAIDVGREMGLSQREQESLRLGAILHDIGKIGIPDAILKKPGPLDAAEWEIMRQHPVIGERILVPIQHLRDAAQIVRHHHEKYDGTGYPDGLVGEAIPLGARILTVVDSYSAIIDRRSYKSARSHEQAVAELIRCAGTQFDPYIVDLFLQQSAQRVEVKPEAVPSA